MLFVSSPTTAQDIKAFCARFSENIRVEYKSTFDQNVRRKLPKSVSAFANSLGGVIVIGVKTVQGIPQEPIEGFEPPPGEELTLTIENICLENINKPILPRTTIVPSDVPGRVFVVIEIEESWESPHAIENSKTVYVRTGNAANDYYEAAEVDLIIELVKRRQEPEKLRSALIERARTHAVPVLPEHTVPYACVSLCPLFPRRALCASEEVWSFCVGARYRGAHPYPVQTLRRIENGVVSQAPGWEFAEFSKFGLVTGRRYMAPPQASKSETRFIDLNDLLNLLTKVFFCAENFYKAFGYRGNLGVEVSINNVNGYSMPWLSSDEYPVDDFLSFEQYVTASQRISSENLGPRRTEVLHDLLIQLCWSFWQANDPFPDKAMRMVVEQKTSRN